jgi:micrococcal nuclease
VPGLAAVLAVLLCASVAFAGALEGTVVRVVDGDTIHVRVGTRVEKVRYIGVNTPEVHHPRKGEEPGGRAAMAVNRTLVERRAVRLETDVQARDRYGRLLAYVWVGDVMVNAELVRRGYAQVMTVPPNVRHQDLFLKLQRDAREHERGLWRGADAGTAATSPPTR